MSWGDVKSALAALMYETDRSLENYSSFLPSAANYALYETSRFISPVIKKAVLSHRVQKNLLGENRESTVHEDTDIVFCAENVKGVYFECAGSGQASITDEAQNVIKSFTFDTKGIYSAFRAKITQSGKITLCFSGANRYMIRNAAMYSFCEGDNESDVPVWDVYRDYDMKELIKNEAGECDFLGFAQSYPVLKVLEEGSKTLTEAQDYFILGGSILRLSSLHSGDYEINYKKCPAKITDQTPDDCELNISSDASSLIPLLMAWRLLKEDDERLAAGYYSEYQNAKLQMLSQNSYNGEHAARVI